MSSEVSVTGGRTEKIRILHVDDEPDFAETSAALLQREDDRFEIETARSAREGLDALGDAVDCIVSDYDMPDRNGIEFLEAVREQYTDVPFILYTGKGSEEVASDAITAGVTEYLQKERGTGQYAVLANRITNAVEQYRSQRALEASQQRLSLLIEQSPLGVLEYDADFEIVGLNPTGEEILGYAEEELRGETWEKLVTSSSYENVDQVTTALSGAEGGYHSIDENVRKDGERIICEWHNRIVTDDDGDVVAIVSLFQDVTDREARTERLERTTARLEALFENSPDMVNVHDAEGNIIEPNSRLAEATGYSKERLAGMKVWDLDRTIDPETARDEWERMGVGDRQRLDGVFRRRDGTTFPVEVHVRRLNLDGDDRFAVISRDVSERMERKAELEQSNALLSALFETLPMGVTVLSGDGTIVRANQHAEDVLGLERADIAGRAYNDPAWQIVDANGVPIADDDLPFARVMATGEAVFDCEHGIEWPDGSRRWLSVDAAPLTTDTDDGDGDNERVVTVVSDITDQREYERAIERQNERLEEFASVVSHDLRNPLRVAEGRLELARDEHDGEHLAGVARAHERMNALIEDLLTLARDGSEVGDVEPVDLGGLSRRCAESVEAAGATVRTDVDRSIRADESRLRQLLENLYRNSVEHGSTTHRSQARGDSVERSSTGSRPRAGDSVEHGAGGVTITVDELDDGFAVEDDGPGIPADERDRVFDAGYSTSQDGTGFGLSIVERIADAHGWELRVTEGAEGGARFEITGVAFADE